MSAILEQSGIGIHTGQHACVRVQAAPTGHGLVFVRTDLPNQPRIPARLEHVCPSARCTRLEANG